MSNSEEDNLCDSMLSAIKNAQKRAKLLNHEDRIALENELGWRLKNDWTEIDVQWVKKSAINVIGFQKARLFEAKSRLKND